MTDEFIPALWPGLSFREGRGGKEEKEKEAGEVEEEEEV